MYAIRSYYVTSLNPPMPVAWLLSTSTFQFMSSAWRVYILKRSAANRITSYNVCYTKLLRLELGDNTAGKILLKKVVKEYPNSNQAKIAKGKLAQVK